MLRLVHKEPCLLGIDSRQSLVNRNSSHSSPIANMDETKLELQQGQAARGGDVSPGEVVVLSEDEQNLASLGYKQGTATQHLNLLIAGYLESAIGMTG